MLITIISFLAGLAIEKANSGKQKKVVLLISLITCLSILFTFKYYNFFSSSIIQLSGYLGIDIILPSFNPLLPVGISFYTFQALSYIIDIYRCEIPAEHSFGIYATFVSFFPQLVAGPIERTKNLLPQLKAQHQFDYRRTTYGLKLMAWGYFKKLVIADCVSTYVERVFSHIQLFQGFALLLATFLFTIQIYCDFSAYSDIARGTAKVLGIELMDNFNSPYFSSSIHEFWSRWHISLSTWFRDYIYIPLGGNRVSKVRHHFNILLTFLVSGLWHGADWTFIIWGGIHGIAQTIENSFHLREKKSFFAHYVSIIAVFLFTMFAWVFFRAQTVDDAFYLFTHIFDGINDPFTYVFNGFTMKNQLGIGMEKKDFFKLICFLGLLSAYDYASLRIDVIEWISTRSILLRWIVYILLIWIIILFMPQVGSSEFVYFQF